MVISEKFIYSADDVSYIDSLATKEESINGFKLMQRAAKFSFDITMKEYPSTSSFIIYCGHGNNAGDGYLFASHAIRNGLHASVIYLSSPDDLKGDAHNAYLDFKSLDGEISQWYENVDIDADIIIDAIFGIGLNRNIKGDYLDCIEAINKKNIPIISLDIASGLCADKGRVMGACIEASITCTFVATKIGLFLESGPDVSGKIFFSNLNIDKCFYQQAKPIVQIFDSKLRKNILKKRNQNTHKGKYGHVLVIGGNRGMAGAVRIAAEAAIRAGAGIVSVVTRPENTHVIAKLRPEIMCHGIDKDFKKIDQLINNADLIAIGPGLGIDEWAFKLYESAITSKLPLIVDADALNILSMDPVKRSNWILTPHPGEASRLISVLTNDIQSERLASLDTIVNQYEATVILKGKNTLVGSIDKLPFMITEGNPGMSSAGMGDLLTGLTAGLLGQFMTNDYHDIAALSANIHALSGDNAALKGERGLIASDLFQEMRPLLNP